jgi:plasmid stabilization system protein ParE
VTPFRLTPQATIDLQQIATDFFQPWQNAEAASYVAALLEATRRLAQDPMIVPERRDVLAGMRVGRHKAHRIWFVPEADGITVVRILHAARHYEDIRFA